MTYFGPEYFALFLPLVVAVYAIMPKKVRPYVLLLASYAFFWIISEKLIAYLLFSTVSIHHFGLWLDKLQQERKLAIKGLEREEKKKVKAANDKQQNLVLALAVIVHIGLLAVLKYTPFVLGNVNTVLAHFDMQVNVVKFMVPIGISFYTLQAVSYMTDVRRGTIKADRNLGRLALYISFFPQIMEGPIARYSDTAESLFSGKQIEYRNFVFGFERIVYGLFKKIIVADRLNEFVKSVFDHYEKYDGAIILIGAIAYTIQLYMDFSGAMDIGLGSARIFGVKLPENFRQPFFSKSVSEFWTRWHITLGTWFRDYIYYPVSFSTFSKKLTAAGRKRLGNYFGPLAAGTVALFCVWICNGIWHGSAWMYIFFGMYHFVMIFTGNLFNPVVTKIYDKLHIDRSKGPVAALRIVKTSFLVVLGELFFRAHGLKEGLEMFKRIFTDFSIKAVSLETIEKAGLDYLDIIVVFAVVAIVFVFGVLKEKNVDICEKLAEKNIAIRWLVVIAAIVAIIIFGAYGAEYTPVAPMYADF